jgi:hypothetical protein
MNSSGNAAPARPNSPPKAAAQAVPNGNQYGVAPVPVPAAAPQVASPIPFPPVPAADPQQVAAHVPFPAPLNRHVRVLPAAAAANPNLSPSGDFPPTKCRHAEVEVICEDRYRWNDKVHKVVINVDVSGSTHNMLPTFTKLLNQFLETVKTATPDAVIYIFTFSDTVRLDLVVEAKKCQPLGQQFLQTRQTTALYASINLIAEYFTKDGKCHLAKESYFGLYTDGLNEGSIYNDTFRDAAITVEGMRGLGVSLSFLTTDPNMKAQLGLRDNEIQIVAMERGSYQSVSLTTAVGDQRAQYQKLYSSMPSQ